MEKLIQSIIRTIPQNIKGAHLLKSTEIFIPYKEVGIECLTREITQINLFFESILKFIEIGVQDLDEISQILGVNYNIIKEVIVDMVEQKYIVTTENKIIMTLRGQQALETRKLVTIRKRYINPLLINLITGEIMNGDGISTVKVDKYDVCLDEEQRINKEYLENHYSIINDIFKKYQMEDNVFGDQSITRELYKILDIAYEKLVYIKNKLSIYRSSDSEEYQFSFEKDVNEQYINCFYKQVKEVVPPSLENFFERDYSFARSHKKINMIDEKLLEKTLILGRKLIECGDRIDESMHKEFQSKRYMITDNEYELYFFNSDVFDWDKLIIISGRLKKIFDNKIWNELKAISRSKEVFIVYDEKEYSIEQELSKLRGNGIKANNIILLKKSNIEENKICFYPSVEIDIFEEVYEMFNRPITLRKGIIEFEKAIIQKSIQQTENDYYIKFINPYIEKSELKGQRDKKKYNKSSISEKG